MFNHRFSLVMEEIKSKERRLFEVEALRQNDSLNEDLWKEFVALKCPIRCLRENEGFRMRSYSLQSIFGKGEVFLILSKLTHANAEFFREHFQSSRGPFFRPLRGAFKMISKDQSAKLKSPFSEIEIQSVVWCCGEDRAPGPDGLNFKILKQNWNIIKDDMIRFFEEFRVKGCFPKALNNSFITLIPKKLCPQDLNDFRPISLISSMYKVLAKVLAERLKSVMELVVGTSQFAFIKNRQILDCILIANEVIHSLKYSKSAAVLINGSPTDFFQLKRGLRQGDPLSPFLFNIVSEGLNALISKAVQTGLFQGVNVRKVRSFPISHLQFVDDTLLFCDAKKESLWNENLVHSCGNDLGCLVGSIPFRYLGLLVGANPAFKAVATCILEEIDKIRRSFFWAKDPSERKLCTIDWNTITKSKQNGGLVSFPRKFALAIHKSSPVCNFGFWEDGQWKWDVKFRRRLFDWEVDQFEAFSSLLNSMMLVASNEDKVIWSIESSGKFSSKSFCYEVENMNYHGNPLLSSIWKFKAPPKARLICWQVLSGKFPIRDILSNVHFVVLAMSIRLKGLPNGIRLMTER
ncbi:cysteine-rich receptor-like protein kinase [Tanacetum coccineum]